MTASADAAARAARRPHRRRRPHRCPSCARRAASAAEAARLAADLNVEWLLLTHTPGNPTPAVVPAHFCSRCAPRGPVTDLACTRCGDGPLIAGTPLLPVPSRPVLPRPTGEHAAYQLDDEHAASGGGATRGGGAVDLQHGQDALRTWLQEHGWTPQSPAGWRCPTCP